jgi:hypothetical protein
MLPYSFSTHTIFSPSSLDSSVESALIAQIRAAFDPFHRRPGAKTLQKQQEKQHEKQKINNDASSASAGATAAWSALTDSVALGINAVTRALESNSARAVIVCGAPDRPAILVAHLFAGAAARQVPALDLPALDGLQLASQLRMRTLGAFAVLKNASEASFVQLAEQVARLAPRVDSLPWIPLYLGEAERQDAQPIGKVAGDAAVEATVVAPTRGKRALAPAQTRRVRSKRNAAAATKSTAVTTTSDVAASEPASTASPTQPT